MIELIYNSSKTPPELRMAVSFSASSTGWEVALEVLSDLTKQNPGMLVKLTGKNNNGSRLGPNGHPVAVVNGQVVEMLRNKV